MRFVLVFAWILHTVNGNECKIPEGIRDVEFNSNMECTTFSMDPNGNYSDLESLAMYSQHVTTEAVYDLLEQLTAAPELNKIGIYNNHVLDSFDISKFNPLKKLRSLDIFFSQFNPQFTAKDDNVNLVRLLTGNGIKDINFLKRFPMLEIIDLSYSKISGVFDLNFLKNFKHLERFNLLENPITEVINTKKDLIMPKLEWISIGNQINFIDFKVFDSFPNLNYLNLNNNKLSGTFDLNILTNLKKLIYIFLERNQFTRIINSGIQKSPYVREIFLSNNKLTVIDLDDFKVYTNLQFLYLSANQLVSICGYSNARNILPSVLAIPIERNEFYCFQLEKMVAPYIGTAFWHWDTDATCPNDKILFQNISCCYPYKTLP